MAIVRYCAEEVRRQGDDPIAVADMVTAWDYAWTHRAESFGVGTVLAVGALIKPSLNHNGFRTVPIWIGWEKGKVAPEDVERELTLLIDAWNEGRIEDADTFYRLFEEIHPFEDGNGRTGKVIYHLILGRLAYPQWPKNWWGISNP
jgi:hypothetical protein